MLGVSRGVLHQHQAAHGRGQDHLRLPDRHAHPLARHPHRRERGADGAMGRHGPWPRQGVGQIVQ